MRGNREWLLESLDREVEEETGGRISKERLRKDRYGAQIFPFHKLGRSIYYDLTEIESVIENSRFGGKAQRAA